jgi:GDPmannose 4,6-dehydratase
VTHGVAKIKLGLSREIKLGNLDAKRDWGFAGDYVKAMWLMLQPDEPGDYVIATGVTHTVQELVEVAFSHVGLPWKEHIVTDPSLIRPAEVDILRGDCGKAERELGWRPEVDFEALVRMMVDADMEQLESQKHLRQRVKGG